MKKTTVVLLLFVVAYYVLHQQAMLPAELEKADDLFLSNALIGVWPIAELAGQAYERSETTREIMRALYTKGISECQQ